MTTLSETGYEILRDAVNVAREFQIPNVAALKFRLATRWPGRDNDIAEAIKFWANCLHERHPGGMPRF